MNARFALAIALSLLAIGCAPRPIQPKIVERLPEPLVGGPERPLVTAPRVVEKPDVPRQPRQAPTVGDQGWAPPGGFSSRWKYVIVHHSADDRSTPSGMIAWHVQRGWDELGYHFVIGNGVGYPDGRVFVGSRWPKQKHGAHTRVSAGDDNRWNEHGIGICLVGNLDQHSPTDRQMATLTRLISYLCGRCHISPEHIFTHGSVDPHTRCPGHNLSLGTIRRRVATAMHPPAIHASSN